jgi:hypothetical protein
VPLFLLLFGLATTAFGFTLWEASQRRMHARHGHPRPPSEDPGAVVDIAWLGDGVVVKVYYEHGAYAAHVYWNEEFIGKAGGFGSTQAAIGWGRSEARRKGADV